MDDRFYIQTILRDDGARLDIDRHELYLAEENTLLTSPDPATTAINYTDSDGGEMIRQNNPAWEEQINGLMFPRGTDYWSIERRLRQFFQINHTYKVVYIRRDGGMFSRGPAWITRALQVPPTPREDRATWTVGLTFGKVLRMEYAEDEEGNEIFANTVMLPLLASVVGGETWDSVGEVWDEIGEVWEGGAGGVQVINIDSTARVYPVWIVHGACVNPSLQNNSTDTVATYAGTVAAGQTLMVDFATGIATLDGAVVSRNLSGQINCEPGENVMGFNSDGGTATTSTLSWNNVVG